MGKNVAGQIVEMLVENGVKKDMPISYFTTLILISAKAWPGVQLILSGSIDNIRGSTDTPAGHTPAYLCDIIMENTFKVLKREEVSAKNQQLFDQLKKASGAVPNLYSTLAYSENALEAYINLKNSKTSLTRKEVEAATLVVSEVNNCVYCLSAHTIVAKLNGFTEEQIIEIRGGNASFDNKLDALVKLAKQLSEKRHPGDGTLVAAFFEAGYSKENLIDLIVSIGDRNIINMLHAVTNVPVEFPLAKALINQPVFR